MRRRWACRLKGGAAATPNSTLLHSETLCPELVLQRKPALYRRPSTAKGTGPPARGDTTASPGSQTPPSVAFRLLPFALPLLLRQWRSSLERVFSGVEGGVRASFLQAPLTVLRTPVGSPRYLPDTPHTGRGSMGPPAPLPRPLRQPRKTTPLPIESGSASLFSPQKETSHAPPLSSALHTALISIAPTSKSLRSLYQFRAKGF